MGLIGNLVSTGQGGVYTEATVEIIGGGGGGAEVELKRDSLILSVDAIDQRDPLCRWNSGKCSVTFMRTADTATAVNAFVASFNNHPTEEFFMKVTINGTLRFVGIITADGMEIEDVAYATEFTLVAHDGMGRLEGKNYASLGDTPYPDMNGGSGKTRFERLPKIIFQCLEKVGTLAHHSGTFFAILHDSTADGQTVSGDPMWNQRVDQNTFLEIGLDDDTFSFFSCKKVLELVMVAYGLQLRYVGPYYLLYQRNLWAAGGTAYAYGTGGTYSGTISVAGENTTINDDKALDSNRKGISSFGTVPPLGSAKIVYDHGDQDVNLLFGVEYSGDNTVYPETFTNLDLSPVYVKPGERVILQFRGRLRSRAYKNPSNRNENHRLRFKIKIKITALGSTYSLDKPYKAYDFYDTGFSNYITPYWSGGDGGRFNFVTNIIDEVNFDNNAYHEVNFDTYLLTAGAVNYIQWGFEWIRAFNEIETEAVPSPIGSDKFNIDWDFGDLSLLALQDGIILKRPNHTDAYTLGDAENASVYKAETLIGDGPTKTAVGRLQFYDGEWKDSDFWGGTRLHQKATDDIIISSRNAQELLLGGFYSLNYWSNGKVTYNLKEYLPLSVQYNVGADEWTGEWVEFMTGAGGTKKLTKVQSKQLLLPIKMDLPDDERLEDRMTMIITGKDPYRVGIDTGVTSIGLRDPATYDYFKTGDKVHIIDPVLGEVNLLTVAADVLTGDTEVIIESWDPEKEYYPTNFPPHSYLRLDQVAAHTKTVGLNSIVWEEDDTFSGTNWPITVMDISVLPALGRVGVNKRIDVWKNGVHLSYQHTVDDSSQFSKGYTIVDDEIVFYETCISDDVQFKGLKI